jgi:hypothetical protein
VGTAAGVCDTNFCTWCQFGQARSEQVEALTPPRVFFWSALQKLRIHLVRRKRAGAFEVAPV